ncbi:MAG: hypothetical protein P4L75_02330 [Clostridia bacterium]|nr:hypothetical protein [Clostridia bacterium]MDR3645522.1 hypothetical protein [Clostridia bacterium]
MQENKLDSSRIAVEVNAIAVALSKQLSVDEQNILGNILAAMGATLLTIAAIEQTNKEQADTAAQTSTGKAE